MPDPTPETPRPSGAQDWMWRAIGARDSEADGTFVFAVTSTGVYCRPSCPSRRPKPENVRFFSLNRDAEAAGFRPCKRCRPTELSTGQVQSAAIEAACRMMEEADTALPLAALAGAAGLSPAHFHRLFKRVTGVTPKAYAVQLRRRREESALKSMGAGGVTQALLAAGYNSPGRFYDGAQGRLGMAPSAFAAGGAGELIRSAVAECWLGLVLVAATARGVCAVRFGDDASLLERELREMFPKARHAGRDAAFEKLLARVLASIERPDASHDLPLDVQGTAFEQKVWAALRAIPAGETRSYGQVAAAIGEPKASRAVGRACGANPVGVLTPCHRVLRADGGAGGYRWGPERKAALLARERKKT